MTELLTVEQVAERYKHRSLEPIHRRAKQGLIPHIKRPGERRIWFRPDWLDAYDSGCELVVVELQGGGRLVKPKEAA